MELKSMHVHSLILVIGIFLAFQTVASTAASNQETSSTTTTSVPSKQNSSVTEASKSGQSGEVTIYFTWLRLPYTLQVSGCTDVPKLLYKKTTSIETNKHCYLLYSRQNCDGRKIKVEPKEEGHVSLTQLDFDEELASLQKCEDEKTHNSIHSSQPISSTAASVDHSTQSHQPKTENSTKASRERRSPTENIELQPIMIVPTVPQNMSVISQDNTTKNSGGFTIIRNQSAGGQQHSVSIMQTSDSGNGIVVTSSSGSSFSAAGIPQGSSQPSSSNNTGVLLTNVIY